MSIEVPQSVRDMVADPALAEGISQLVSKLDGKKMIAADWQQSRNYVRALSSAAMARSDYITFMHDLWDATWGKADLSKLGAEVFDETCTPSQIWENDEIWRCFRTGPSAKDGIAVFYVCAILQKGIRLEFGYHKADWSELNATELVSDAAEWSEYTPEGWNSIYWKSKTIPFGDLEQRIDELSTSANSLVSKIPEASG